MSQKRGAVAMLAALVGLLGPLYAPQGAAAQQSASAQVTNTFIGELRGDNANGVDNDDDYGAVIDRFNLSAVGEGLVGQLRVDYFHFLPDPPAAGFEDSLRLERLSVIYSSGPWEVIGGDFYRQLGRGIALSLRKNDESAVDVTLQGGQLGYQGDDHQATLFAGRTNPANLDGVSQRFVADTRDRMVGGSWDWTGTDLVQVGAYGLYMQTREELLGEKSNALGGGLTFTLPAPTTWLSLYAEGDVQRREVIGVASRGYAAYATADTSFLDGDLVFLLEGIHLQDYELQGSQNTALGQAFDYNQPPTLERLDQQVANLRDVDGVALRSEYYFFDLDLLLFAAGNLRLNDPKGPSPLQTSHSYGGAKLNFQEGISRVQLSAGYRDERQDGQTLRTMVHAELDYLQSLVRSEGLSAHLQVMHEMWTQEEVDFLRGTSVLSLEWSRAGSLSYEFGYDTQDPRVEIRSVFHAGIAQWSLDRTFDFESVDQLSMALVVGTRRGGIRCVAGVCRDFPEFAGAQGRVIVRY